LNGPLEPTTAGVKRGYPSSVNGQIVNPRALKAKKDGVRSENTSTAGARLCKQVKNLGGGEPIETSQKKAVWIAAQNTVAKLERSTNVRFLLDVIRARRKRGRENRGLGGTTFWADRGAHKKKGPVTSEKKQRKKTMDTQEGGQGNTDRLQNPLPRSLEKVNCVKNVGVGFLAGRRTTEL